jgi:hypothetical protein
MTHVPPTSPAEIDRLVSAHLDDALSPAEAVRLESLLASDPAVAAALARAAVLHDRLHDLLRSEGPATAVTPATAGSTSMSLDAPPRRWPAWSLRRAGMLTALVAAACSLLLLARDRTASAAAVALDRIVAAIEARVDREYRITVLDHGPHGPPRTPPTPGGGRKPGVDGARLFLRGSDQFVLVRRFEDGSEFITGSDGSLGWAVPPRGRVHLSRDPRRFRRGVPGEHEELPFLDLRTGLDSLRRGYDLAVLTDASGGQRLEATRRPERRRGPACVRVWFDAAGVATRIEIEGLPPQDAMPEAVALDLISQRPLGGGFFSHAAHHSLDRDIDWE